MDLPGQRQVEESRGKLRKYCAGVVVDVVFLDKHRKRLIKVPIVQAYIHEVPSIVHIKPPHLFSFVPTLSALNRLYIHFALKTSGGEWLTLADWIVTNYKEKSSGSADESKAALQQAKEMAIQCLHSVAYEVDQVSSGINEMIRFQTTNMAQCGAQLSLPDNNVDQHVEQCGRRGIATMASGRIPSKPQPKYQRVAIKADNSRRVQHQINFRLLDSVGVGGVGGGGPSPVRAPSARGGAPGPASLQQTRPPSSNSLVNENQSSYSPTRQSSSASGRGAAGFGAPVAPRAPVAPSVPSAPSAPKPSAPPPPPPMAKPRISPRPSPVPSPRASPRTARSNLGAPPPPPPPPPAPAPASLSGAPPPPPPPPPGGLPFVVPGPPPGAGGGGGAPPPPPPPPPGGMPLVVPGPPPPPPPPPSGKPLLMPSWGAGDEAEEAEADPRGRTNTLDTEALPPPPPPADAEEAEEVEDLGPVLYKAKALYDYAGEQADELTFAEDDMLCILEENSDGWMKGYIESAGEPGMFPGNYVEKA